MEGTVPSLPWNISFNPHQSYEMGAVLIPILQMDKLRD